MSKKTRHFFSIRSHEEFSMRWPIQNQLLLPLLTVMVLTIIVVSAVSAFLGFDRARHMRQENLRRVIATSSEVNFPLGEPILRQMSGLSGAEFVFFDRDSRLQASTLRLTVSEQETLRKSILQHEASDGQYSPAMLLRERPYLCQRVTIHERQPFVKGGWLVVLYPEEKWTTTMWQAAYPALLVGTVAICAVVLISIFLAHRFARPIRRLNDRAIAIAQGNFEPLPITRPNDEIRDLTVTINQMAERLGQYESEVRRHEQLRTLGQLGASLAHQLRNAATGGRMAIELHQLHCTAKEDQEGLETLDVALRQFRLMESYLHRFTTLGQIRNVPHQIIELDRILEDAIDLVRPRAVHSGIDLVYNQSDDDFRVSGDADALRQMFVNLLVNAVEAIGIQADGCGRILVERGLTDEGNALVKIGDSGPGPSADVSGNLFEPFVTAKPEGTGLGLYVARQTVEAHQGKISWRRENEMTWFCVELKRNIAP